MGCLLFYSWPILILPVASVASRRWKIKFLLKARGSKTRVRQEARTAGSLIGRVMGRAVERLLGRVAGSMAPKQK